MLKIKINIDIFRNGKYTKYTRSDFKNFEGARRSRLEDSTMFISRDHMDSTVIIRVKGMIRLSESGKEFCKYLQDAFGSETGAVLVDLSEVDEVDSNGLGELVAYFQRFEKTGRIFGILSPSARIRKLFEFTRLDQVFPIFYTLEEARRHLGQQPILG